LGLRGALCSALIFALGISMLTDQALDTLFRNARTHNGWLDQPIADETLHQLFDLLKMAPTSANSQPARFVFVKSAAAKAKLKPALLESNVEKTMTAPVTVIVGTDFAFYEHLPKLFPHADARSWFVGNQTLIDSTAFRNASLQGAYLMLAARALGLDCGAMSGFNAELVDQRFFEGTTVRSNFLVNLGFGDVSKLFGRSPRFEFAEACRIE
jgi:3-hydroxypropanoate dehydrogenase